MLLYYNYFGVAIRLQWLNYDLRMHLDSWLKVKNQLIWYLITTICQQNTFSAPTTVTHSTH